MRTDRERGASMVMVTAGLMLLLGAAAVAIDAGAGFNERRQDQTSADMGVLAGALDFFTPGMGSCGGTADGGCDNILSYVRSNLTSTYTDAQWAGIWQTCTDPDKPVGFGPLPADTADPLWTGFSGTRWDGAIFADTVDCVSRSSSEIRVRVPDQLIDTSFGRVLAVDQLATHAVAQARLVFGAGGFGAVIPFGVLNGAKGYDCLLQPPSGISEEPCVGGTTGNYGAIFSQTWGSDATITDCTTSTWGPEIRINTALGLDHFLEAIQSTSNLPADPDAFKTQVGQQTSYPLVDADTLLDRCAVSGGVTYPWDQTQGSAMDIGVPNTVEVDTGADAGDDAFEGLIIGTAADFPNATAPSSVEPRLTFVGETCTDANDSVSPFNGVAARCLDLGTYGTYVVDDAPLWDWLLPGVTAGDYEDPDNPGNQCSGAIDNPVTMDCILRSPDLDEIFDDDIVKSRRFVWTPEFYYSSWASGTHWQPVIGFKPTYIHGLWFNSPGPGLQYYEAGTNPGQIDVQNPNAMRAASSFILPSAALPADVANGCPTCTDGDVEPELSR